jgi:hypothetical protein
MSWTRFHPVTRIVVVAGSIVSIASLTGWERVGDALANFSPAGGFESRCEDLPATAVSVVLRIPTIAENRTVASADLSRMSTDTGPDVRTIGLTQAKFGHRSTLEVTGIADRLGTRACVRPNVTVELFVSPMTVYVAREYGGDPCRARAIREHEQRHVDAYLGYAHESVPRLREAIERSLGRDPHFGLSVGESQSDIDRLLRGTLTSFMREAERTLATRQAAIDTPEEYERVRLACATG